MKLLPVHVVSLILVLVLGNVDSTVTDDEEKIKNDILQLEEELYQLTKQDTQAKSKEKVAAENAKKSLRAPCGFSGGNCVRRRSSRRRGTFWGKKSKEQTAYSTFGQDNFDQILLDIEKLAKVVKNEKKNKQEF